MLKQMMVMDTDTFTVGTPVKLTERNEDLDGHEETVHYGMITRSGVEKLKIWTVSPSTGMKSGKTCTIEDIRTERKTLEPLVEISLLEEAQDRIEEYERQGGTINMERSWKSKYKRALERANAKLEALGNEPVRIRNPHPDVTGPGMFEPEPAGHVTFGCNLGDLLKGGHVQVSEDDGEVE